jgi:hypothetical protein
MASSPDRGVAGSNPPSTVCDGLGQCHDRSLRRSATWVMSTTRPRPSGTSFAELRPDRWLERWNAGSPSRRGHAVLPDAGRRSTPPDAGLAVQPRNVATQTEASIIYALGHMLREKITIRNGRVLDSRRGFDPATPRSGELAISPYDSGDDGCRSADDQRTILRPVPCSRFPQ